MRFTVITPTRNRRQWIRKATQSVLNQTFQDWEMIVLDVGDEGETCEDIVPDDPRIRYVRGECRGPAADFQAALGLATGDIVTPLSDDDRLPRHALETADVRLGDATWLNGRTVLIDADGEPIAFRGGTWDHMDDTRRGQYMLGGAVYWRKTLTDELGGFDSAFDSAGDFELYTRFLKHSDPVLVKDTLYIYTDHAGTDSRVNAERQADASRRVAHAAA